MANGALPAMTPDTELDFCYRGWHVKIRVTTAQGATFASGHADLDLGGIVRRRLVVAGTDGPDVVGALKEDARTFVEQWSRERHLDS